jgi:ABC-type transport system involved in multi-copper enzyme maturation permease subunit
MRTTDLWLTDAMSRELGIAQRQRIGTIAVLTYLLLIVLGASAIGAEYRAGTVSTVLTWEPRRVRLLAARLGAVALVCLATFLFVSAVFIGGWALGASLAGSTAGADGDFWREIVAVTGRGAVLAVALPVISAALATIGRNTAAALGIWFGYLVAIEGILTANVKATTPWMLTVSSAAFYGWERINANQHTVTPGAGTLHVALFGLVLGAAGFAAFARRDVT